MTTAIDLIPEPLIVETAERVFAGLSADAPPGEAWVDIEACGLARAWVSESLGGAGARVVDGVAVARAAGRYALTQPVAETLLGAFALQSAQMTVPGGPLSLVVAPGDVPEIDGAGRLHGAVSRVPFAGDAAHLVVPARASSGWRVAMLAVDQVAVEREVALSGDARDRVCFDAAACAAVGDAGNAADADALLCVAAMIRSAQMAGALERVLEMTLEYARQREQFGRPISRFQAVQHELAKLAGEATAASAAANAAMSALARFGMQDPRTRRAAAVAKIRCGEAAGAGAAIAHQVHGAMGISQEYPLQRFTRRLWTWRDDYGAEASWAMRLGGDVAAAGAAALWPSLTDA